MSIKEPYNIKTNPTGYKPGTIEEKQALAAKVAATTGSDKGGNKGTTLLSQSNILDPVTGQPVNDANIINNGKDTTLVGLYSDAMSDVSKLKQVKDLLVSNGQLKASKSGTIPRQVVLDAYLKVLIGASMGYSSQKNSGVAPTYSIQQYLKELQDSGFGIDTSETDTTPKSTVTSKESGLATIQDAFTKEFSEGAPPELINAYRDEVKQLELSRTTKTTKVKGVDVGIYGVSELERKNILDKYIKQHAETLIANAATGDPIAQSKLTKGNFGLTYTTVKNAYSQNGIPFNPKVLSQQVIDISTGVKSQDSITNLINIQAATYFPALADKIGKGHTVKELLTPYISTRANILEEDPDAVDMQELQKVAKDPKGLMGLYDYEVSLRSDPKWRFTKNAQDSMASVARGLAQTFGLAG